MKYISLIIFVFSLGLTNVSIGYAEDSPRTIKVIGRKEASVTTKVITLSDVARIESKRVEDDDVIIGLQKIVIQESPAPGESVGIPALSILERIKHSGVDTEQIGYMFPRVIKVKRASRTIRIEEIRGAIERYLSKTGRDANLNSIQYNNDVEVAPGLARISAIPTGQARAGKTKFQVQVDVEDERRVAFDIPVDIDEWLEVPVANRPLPKGSVISPIDIARARLNMASMPDDTAIHEQNIVGFETNRNIGFGEVFRKPMLHIPPVITSGSKVTVFYKSAAMEATASGVAVEDGIEGSEIRVRNDNSNKVITGRVVGPGMVQVGR